MCWYLVVLLFNVLCLVVLLCSVLQLVVLLFNILCLVVLLCSMLQLVVLLFNVLCLLTVFEFHNGERNKCNVQMSV